MTFTNQSVPTKRYFSVKWELKSEQPNSFKNLGNKLELHFIRISELENLGSFEIYGTGIFQELEKIRKFTI